MWLSSHSTTSLTQSPKGILGTGVHLLHRSVALAARSDHRVLRLHAVTLHGLHRLAEHGEQALARYDTDDLAVLTEYGDGRLAGRAGREQLDDRGVLGDRRRGVGRRVPRLGGGHDGARGQDAR